MTNALLSIYLNDHLLGSTFGVGLFRRAARDQTDSTARKVLADLTPEVEEDRAALISIMARLEIPRRRYKALAGGVAERLSRLKLNGSLVRRSPLSDLVELETLYLGVTGKVSCWETLSQLPPNEPRLDAQQLAELSARGTSQLAALRELRQHAAQSASSKLVPERR